MDNTVSKALSFARQIPMSIWQFSIFKRDLFELERLAEIGRMTEKCFGDKLYFYSGYEDERWVHIADAKDLKSYCKEVSNETNNN